MTMANNVCTSALWRANVSAKPCPRSVPRWASLLRECAGQRTLRAATTHLETAATCASSVLPLVVFARIGQALEHERAHAAPAFDVDVTCGAAGGILVEGSLDAATDRAPSRDVDLCFCRTGYLVAGLRIAVKFVVRGGPDHGFALIASEVGGALMVLALGLAL